MLARVIHRLETTLFPDQRLFSNIQLAERLEHSGDNAGAMAQLLESIRIDRGWNEEAARLQLLEFFKTLGAANPDVMTARRQLSTLLFA